VIPKQISTLLLIVASTVIVVGFGRKQHGSILATAVGGGLNPLIP
jgi:hypothetical protein